MKAIYNGINLHELGDVTISSRQGTYSPPELPQQINHTLTLSIDVWQRTWTQNHDLIEQIIAALKTQGAPLKLESADATIDVSGTPTVVPGETFLDRQVTVQSHTLPDDPNSWGTYHQAVTITFAYVETDVQDDHHLTIVFTKTRVTPIPGQTLGNVTSWKEEFQVQRFDEFKNLRRRHSGNVSCSGFIPANTNLNNTADADNLETRRAALILKANALRDEMDGQTGRLEYKQVGATVFDKIVRIESLGAEVNQAVDGVKWDMTFSYTQFPNEDSFAAAEFKVGIKKMPDAGNVEMLFTGKISGSTDLAAVAKLDTIRIATLADQGFNAADIISENHTQDLLNVPDSDDGQGGSPNTFTVLNFEETYRRRLTLFQGQSLVSWTLGIDDSDALADGTRTRTYSGSVTASGATADAAYSAAAAKASELGDNKYPFRMSGKVAQSTQKIAQGDIQFVQVDFAYGYKIKGTRIHLALSTAAPKGTFDEYTRTISGTIQAKSKTEAFDVYESEVFANYSSGHVRRNDTKWTEASVQDGTYGFPGSFSAQQSYLGQFGALEFTIEVLDDRAGSDFAFSYNISIETEYLSNTLSTEVSGRFRGSPSDMQDAADNKANNKIDQMLVRLGYSILSRISESRSLIVEEIGIAKKNVGVSFTSRFRTRLSTAAQVLRSKISETIVYAGNRWVAGAVPDGPAVMMYTGVKEGSRTVSGSVVATTEAAAMAWINTAKEMAFPGVQPTTRYRMAPTITRSWEFDAYVEGIARGTPNHNIVQFEFSQEEVLPNFLF